MQVCTGRSGRFADKKAEFITQPDDPDAQRTYRYRYTNSPVSRSQKGSTKVKVQDLDVDIRPFKTMA